MLLDNADAPLYRTELSHRGFSAIVLVDGVPAHIYRAEYDTFNDKLVEPLEDKRIMTGWIASEEGKTFSVAFQNDEGEDAEVASCGHIFVDGQDVASAILRPGRRIPVVRHGVRMSTSVTKPFTFSKLKLTDDENLADPKDPRAKDLGTIRVEIVFVKLGQVVPLKRVDAEGIDLMHEKAKKAGLHTTKYETSTRTPKSRAVSTTPLHEGKHVVFLFRYRPKDVLMADGYMPRPTKREIVAEEVDVFGSAPLVPRQKRSEPDSADTEDEEEISPKRSKSNADYLTSEDDAGL